MNHDEGTRNIPDELLARWRDLPEEERRELVRTWELAETAREAHPDPLEAERRLMGAIADSTPRADRRSHRGIPIRWLSLGAAALVVIAAGVVFYLAQRSPDDVRTAAAAREFMLLLHGEPLTRYPQEEHARIIGEYVAWARELGDKNRFVRGNDLAPGGRILQARSGTIQSRQIEDVENAVSGYFIVTASDFDEAVRIASDSPHLKYDGTVEVRQIGTH